MKSSKDFIDDIFEELDLIDDLELEDEDKVIYSKEMTDRIRNEIRKEVANLPIGSIVAQFFKKKKEEQEKDTSKLESSIKEEIEETEEELEKEIKKESSRLETLISDGLDKLKKEFGKLRNELANQTQYQFGGFSPQTNDLNIGTPEVEGAWRIVKVGDNLSVQRYESGAWVEKGSFTAI